MRLIPAFTALNNSIFYLRIYTPSLNVVYDQIKKVTELRDAKHNNKESDIKKIFKHDLDLNKNFIIVDRISFNYREKIKLLKNINLNTKKKFSFYSRSNRFRQNHPARNYNGANKTPCR